MSKCYKQMLFTLVILALLLNYDMIAVAQTPSGEESQARAYLQQKKFKVERVGELKDQDGTHLAFTTYKAEDGTLVTLIHGEFATAVEAQEFFEKEVTKAVRVIEKGNKTGQQKKIVGKRAEADFDSGRSTGPLHAVLWTAGPDFFKLQSISLIDVTEFEKSMS
jgi:hypothetical protein